MYVHCTITVSQNDEGVFPIYTPQYEHEQFPPLPYGIYITVAGARGYAAIPRPLGQNTGRRVGRD